MNSVEKFYKYDKILILSGAGVSYNSGIKTFRGNKDSYYNDGNIDDMFIRKFFNYGSHIDDFFRMFNEDSLEPNKAHYFAKELYNKGKLLGIVTQNIDHLYEKSGIPIGKIVHIHGEYGKLRCLKCKKELEISESYKSKKGKYHSKCCNWLADINIILYGDSFRQDIFERYLDWIEYSDCLIVMGSNLEVISHKNIVKDYRKDKYLLNRDDLCIKDTVWKNKYLGDFKDIL